MASRKREKVRLCKYFMNMSLLPSYLLSYRPWGYWFQNDKPEGQSVKDSLSKQRPAEPVERKSRCSIAFRQGGWTIHSREKDWRKAGESRIGCWQTDAVKGGAVHHAWLLYR